MKAKKLVILALCVISQMVANAQFTTNTITPAEAVALLINDPNIVVSNITYTGAAAQLGSMTGFTGTNFQISDAVILSTDDANQIGDFSITSNSAGMGGVDGDADLLTIANSVPPLIGQTFSVGAVNDVAILEFDFVPTGDVVSFNYIFGSDEYLTYVNSSFNDVFAFLISGPGITGPFAAPAGFPGGSANIAFVPQTSPELPITISSVNNALNSQYFVDNVTTSTNPNIQLNGYTVTMVATTSVTCGETYHIRLAIADGSDHWLNSVVCLQAGSFEVTTNVDLTPSIQDPSSTLPYATFLEGCVDGSFVVSPPCQFNTQDVTVLFGGSATNGVDYHFVGSPVITLAPSQDVSLAFTTVDDNIAEGVEIINVSFVYINIDGVVDTASADVAIVDQTPMVLSIQDQVICEGSEIAIDATPAGGFGSISYLWSDQSTNHLDVINEFGNYTVTATDMCGKSIQANFNILAPDTLLINLPDSLGVCPSGSVDYTALAVGGIDPYTYTWSVGGSGADITFTASDAGYVFVNVFDDCNKTASDSMKIYLPEPFSVDPILEICLDDNGLIAPHGGSYPLSFDYDHELLTSTAGGVYVGKKVGSDYVVVTDACGEMDSTLVSVVICNTQFYDIISPNGDGKNDTFEIVGIDHFQRSELTIWNRWGTEVYHSLSYANTWAAQESSDGTYYWQLLRSDGKSFSGIVTVVDSTKK